jgi:hypothetical protein
MTLSETELETRLRRDLQDRADRTPPAPRDLAEVVRSRHRALRRRELGLAGAALAAVLVVVGVPVVASTFSADPDRGQTARPTTSGGTVTPESDLYETPTRGGLAEDTEWLDEVAQLPWDPGAEYRDPGMELTEGEWYRLPEPAADTRHVAYADDVPSGRVALVVGISQQEVAHAWFVGPRGAEPDEMTRAAFPMVWGFDAVALVDGAADDDTLTLVVVADPGDVVERPLVPVVDADGDSEPAIEPVDLVDGIAVLEVDRRWARSDAGLLVRRGENSQAGVTMSATDRAGLAPMARVEPADPRDQARLVPRAPLAMDTAHLLRRYGLTAEEGRPTLLAAGPVDRLRSAYLLGITFPSGATGLVLTTYQPGNPAGGSTGSELPYAAAGTDLLDRVVVAGVSGGLLVSAPDGVRADVLDAAGTVLQSVPLTSGAGTGDLADAPAAATVRIVDRAGNVVAETPIEVYG